MGDLNGNAGGGDEIILGWLGLPRIVFLDYDKKGKKKFFSGKITFLKINYPLFICYGNLRFFSPFLIIKIS